VEAGFAPGRALNYRKAHDLIAKPLTLWRIMRVALLDNSAASVTGEGGLFRTATLL
jgi:hypothetical protein